MKKTHTHTHIERDRIQNPMSSKFKWNTVEISLMCKRSEGTNKQTHKYGMYKRKQANLIYDSQYPELSYQLMD